MWYNIILFYLKISPFEAIIRYMFDYIARALRSFGIENYNFEARALLGHLSRGGPPSKEAADAALGRRRRREPLQYILGEWDFCGETYKLNRGCLIPRPETELLAQYIMEAAPHGAKLADLCCGCGCVALSVLKRRLDMSAIADDISHEALEAARLNAKFLGVESRIEFFAGDIFKDEILPLIVNRGFLAANPPYLSAADMEAVRREGSEVSYEPEAALFGGADGLDFYRRLAGLLAKAPRIERAAFEVGLGQAGAVCALLGEVGFEVGVIKDYSGIDRIVSASRS